MIDYQIGNGYNHSAKSTKSELPGVKILVERNIADDAFAEAYPYITRVDIISATMDRGRVYQVPVFVRYQGLQKSFGVDVCGFRLEAKKPHLLAPQIENLLRGLILASRIPNYVFVARRARAIFPVYTIEDQVMATTPVGPVFKHVELAKVREYLTDFLHDANILGEKGLSDKLHVRGISTNTLGLRRPVMYLKKRIPGEVDFWAPVFQSGDGQYLYAYAASNRQEVSRQADDEVLQLHQKVAEALQADQRLHQTFDLRADRLMPAYWKRLKSTLRLHGQIEVSGQMLEVYENGRFHLAVESRPDEERYGLFLGQNMSDLRRRIKQDFTRRGMI
ncbi:MAG: hypothetical protein DWQ04_31610 [Chloroflexi bacterium]|nr:MAG: hypothetical protein DWQ04_31610 [Chloroflexota bacterium]